jgi:hypothetical protein
MNHATILLFAFGTDVILEFFDPGFAFFSVKM